MANETVDEVKHARTQSHAFIVAVGFCTILAVIFGTMVFSQGGNNDKIELLNRINPNEASVVSLARLPGIGVSRANAIVNYRREYAANGGQGAAFKSGNDLDKVKGIGPATMQNIKQWLEFREAEFSKDRWTDGK